MKAARDIKLLVPRTRSGGIACVLRAVWTAPTSAVGHAVARLAGCGRPERIGGVAARATLYRLPSGRCRGCSAIAIGHVVIVEPSFAEHHGPWLLAHELAHTRQHDWLGPVYLPVHAVLQAISLVLYAVRPLSKYSPVHAYNPLERTFICVPIDVVHEPPLESELTQKVLRAFALAA